MADRKSVLLKFKMFSGGTITIEREKCLTCESHACVRNCVSSTLDPVLKIEKGLPALARTDVKPESGWCVECLACELDCQLLGNQAIRIRWPEKIPAQGKR